MEKTVRFLKENKVDVICFIVICIIVFSVFLPWITKGHLSTDDYTIQGLGYENYKINNNLNDGRVFMVLFIDLAILFKIPVIVFSQITLIISLIISNITIIILKKILFKKIKTKNTFTNILCWIFSFLIIYNFTYLDNLYYVETIVMAFSMILALLAAKTYTEKNRHYLLKTIGLLILSVLNYQFMIVTFIIYVLLFDIISEKRFKTILKDLFVSAGFLVLMIVIDAAIIFVIQKISSISASSIEYRVGHLNIIENINDLPMYFNNLLFDFSGFINNAHGMTYDNFVWISYVVIIAYALIFSIVNRSKRSIFSLIIFIITSLILSYAFHLIIYYASTASRMKTCMGMFFGIIAVCILFELSNCKNDNLRKFFFGSLIIVSVIYGLINIVNYADLVNQEMKVNEIEQKMGQELKTSINQSGKIIDNLDIIYDNNRIFGKHVLKTTRECNITRNAFTCEWSIRGALKCFGINTIKNENVYSAYREDLKQSFGKIKNWFEIRDNKISVGVWEI